MTAGNSCNGGWQSNFGNEYCIMTVEETHDEARDICHDMKSELASITSDAECDYVASLMSVNVCDYLVHYSLDLHIHNVQYV